MKRKKLNRLTGLVPTRNYESYNPLLETDNRVGRRFGVGLLASAFVNLAILGGAGLMASKLPIAKTDSLLPIDIFLVPKEEPAPLPTPPAPQVAMATPPPPVEVQRPEPERQREPDRTRPEPQRKPVPERVRPTPPPVQVAIAEKPKPLIPTPEPVVATPPPTRLEQEKPKDVSVKAEAAQQEKREETSIAKRVAEMPKPTTQALAPKSEMGSTAAVVAPTRNRNPRDLVGATTTVASRSRTLAEMKEEASAAGGGNPVSVSAAAAGTPGSGPALNARAVSASSASNDQSQPSLNTASAGNASVLDNTPTRSIRGPVASTGALSARSKVLTAMGSTDKDDANSFSFVQGGTVTAGKVVGTQGATARGTTITSASGVAQPQFAGADNGIKTATPGGVPIRGPRIAAGNPGLSGPRTRSMGQVTLGDAGGQIGTPGNFNSSLPGGGGVSGSGMGGSGGAGGAGGSGSSSLRARGGSIGTGGGTGGGALRAQTSGSDAVASSRIGRPTNGRIAANGSTTAGPRGRALSTTSVGSLDGPSGGAGDVDGTPGGQGRAGRSSGRAGTVDGAPTGGSLGAKTGTGGSDTVASDGEGRGKGEVRAEKGDTTGPSSKLQRSANAEATFRPEPEIPDSMRSEKFATSVGVHVSIGSNGRASYDLTRSSGSDVIDRLVTRTLSRWKWKAAIRNGEAVSSDQNITITLRVR